MAPSVLPIWWCLLCLGALPAFDTIATSNKEATLFPDDDKPKFVKAHNRLRQTAAPEVANMQFMIWDDNLETAAKTAINDAACAIKDKYVTADNRAENVYWGTSVDPIDITKHWYRCKNNFDNIMWHSSDTIGCAINKGCNVVLCVYNKPNTPNKKVGRPCSRCPAGENCFGGLCAGASVTNQIKEKYLDSSTKQVTLTAATTAGGDCRLPDCINGGTKDEATCLCTGCSGYKGPTCEDKDDHFTSSYRLKFQSVDTTDGISQPVSLSLFNEKIKSILENDVAEAINTVCKTTAGYTQCCTGAAESTWAANSGTKSAKSHVKSADVKLIQSTIGNDCDGSLFLNIYVTAITGTHTDSICTVALLKPEVTQAVLTLALNTAWKDAFSAKLAGHKTKLAKLQAGALTDTAPSRPSCSSSPPTRTTCNKPTPSPQPQTGTPGTGTGTSKQANPDTPKQANPATPKQADQTGKNSAHKNPTASLAPMLFACFCTIALLCFQSMAF